MKKIFKSILILTMAIAIAGTYSSCEKEDSVGEPSIKYVRVTNPVSSDSLLVGAYQGNLIAIVGENLQNAVEIWFNDQKAALTPTYITSNTILVRIPSPVPKEISNKMKIIFSDGSKLEYNFKVQISEPIIQDMLNEYTLTGSIATIRGNYFYDPISVTFTGGAKGEIVSVKDQVILVRIPAGAQPGQIVVKTNFGETKSSFLFRDNRPMFIDSDPYEGWWNSSYVVSNPAATDPPKINGSYIRINKSLGSWSWNELAGGPASAMPVHCKNVPDAAILKPSDYNLKFEINTLKPYNGSIIRINVGLNSEDNNAYQWKPPYDTKGQWETVIIPFEEVVASYAVKPVINPNGYWTRLLMQGPGDLTADICFDNFRVVPKIIK